MGSNLLTQLFLQVSHVINERRMIFFCIVLKLKYWDSEGFTNNSFYYFWQAIECLLCFTHCQNLHYQKNETWIYHHLFLPVNPVIKHHSIRYRLLKRTSGAIKRYNKEMKGSYCPPSHTQLSSGSPVPVSMRFEPKQKEVWRGRVAPPLLIFFIYISIPLTGGVFYHS